MTRTELENQYIQTEHGIFTPRYEYADIETEITNENGTTEIVKEFDNTVIKIAEAIYQEWLEQQNNSPVPEPTLEERLSVMGMAMLDILSV